jgi:hypothetical protein
VSPNLFFAQDNCRLEGYSAIEWRKFPLGELHYWHKAIWKELSEVHAAAHDVPYVSVGAVEDDKHFGVIADLAERSLLSRWVRNLIAVLCKSLTSIRPSLQPESLQPAARRNFRDTSGPESG